MRTHRPSWVRFSQPPGSVSTQAVLGDFESSEVKGVCPESDPQPREVLYFGKVLILYELAQAKRKVR
jgi:hypothetical protein